MLLFSLSAFGSESTWYESFYSSKRLERNYDKINKNFSSEKFREIFDKRTIQCESDVIKQLLPLGASNIKFGILLANKKSYIDEVETDILLSYTNYLKSGSTSQSLEISKGKEIIKSYYERLINQKGCLKEKWEDFSSKISVAKFEGDPEALSSLNNFAYNNRYLSKDNLMLLEMVRLYQSNMGGALSIKSYHEKRSSLEEEAGYTLISKVMEFHTTNREKKNSRSSRYEIYSKFSLLQMKEMISLLNSLNKRFNYQSSQIVFLEDGEVKESFELNRTQQIRAGLKIYAKEKKTLISQPYFKGKDFTYRDLVTLAYETNQINDNELNAFARFETKVKKKNFWQKVTGFAARLNFVVSSLTGPVIGIGYSLTISMLDNIVSPKTEKKAEYEHDLFYGNCEMKL